MRSSWRLATAMLAMTAMYTVTVEQAVAVNAPETPPALRVKIEPRQGLKKIKVRKSIDVLVSCSRECRIRARVTVTAGKDSLSFPFKRLLQENRPFNPGVNLDADGLAYLKEHLKSSRFRIHVSAVDVETGATVAKTRTYRFKR